MILVVGSTGLLGGSITSLLLERDGGDGVRVLVRSEEAWRAKGGTVVVVGGPALRGEPVVLVGEGNRRHSMIAVRDVAAFTVACLDHPAAERETIPLGGPGAVSWRDVVRTFEEALGRAVNVQTVPPGDPVPGLPDVMVQFVAGMETYDSVLDMDVIRATFGVWQTSLREFVDGFVGAAR